jgi:phosphate transport system substrate-binding protein
MLTSPARRITRRPLTAAAAAWLVLSSALVLLIVAASPAFATGPPVTGAGSTWVQIALDQWRADYAHFGYQINYSGVGSSAGRNFYIINQVDFAATEIPFQPDEVTQLQAEHKTYQYLPDVAGGTSLMYNLHTTSGQRIRSLNIDSNAAALIFTGKINSWQDPAITRLNPGLQIRDTHITPVIRSDGSGTSAQFSLYLENQQPSLWQQFVSQYGCAAPCSTWPLFPGATGQSGSDGVANFIANDTLGSGAIGYVEAGYAYGRDFPVGNLHNRSGHYVQPSAQNVATALTHAKLNPDLTQDLRDVYNAPEANAYPMSSYSYMVTPTAEGFGFTADKGRVLSGWIVYIACKGQQSAAPLGYSPLPKNLIQADFDAVNRIPGHVTPPPIDYEHCPNPNLPHGGGGGSHTPPPSGGGSSTPPSGGSTGPSGGQSGPSGSNPSGTSDPGASPTPTTGVPISGAGNQPPPGVEVTTLTQEQQQAAYQAALKSASYAQPEPIMPLVVTALGVLVLVFAPVLLQVRHRPPDQPRSATERLRDGDRHGVDGDGG